MTNTDLLAARITLGLRWVGRPLSAAAAPAKAADSSPSQAAAQPANGAARRPAAMPADFWARPSYEIEPERKGNRFDWPAWEAAVTQTAMVAPSEGAARCLQAEVRCGAGRDPRVSRRPGVRGTGRGQAVA